ncbi:uncharacterized protein LOC103994993 [Musa acuminata AAA Group]|uniref:Uncharacterized protein n=2 Tax=Musa acuminata TaxID=4641 RepID=A0A804K6S9_MUSAM|nr:PREDICTED: UPF0565 protein C2orf69 homolog [Musa acuminata subsp. malaccensis]XP_009413753.1 PREDICTED: UPF0565 protein C2orf69 homolog [Musa acuminata subsp. malaccensis]XP_009413754.1 PREDICTED: UPF0565 protein C2orf69 homolog [Musa acuminata subsp. malaccensis]XP_018685077.1 PREDICTED: UPF0565 protein C2orf69 homolog [Musa acuminata subsp. malaccensis]XP_018685078.1 PREDICTED: UPF0565 protein C2orf69 homolog [Musa acuminata subsp. malaccensis]XP_018685080.1 PREDICTED: UPF0565 protein C2o
MDRWTGCFKVSLNPTKAGSCLKVAASLMFSPSSRTLLMPSVNAILFNGDKVQGTGNSVIERLSDSRNISELLVSKLGCSANVWVVEASTFNGPFAVYKEFIPSLTSRGDPKRYDPNGFPASSAIVAILSRCFEQVPSLTSSNLVEQTKGNVDAPTLLPTPFPKTIILGFSKGGTVVNQLVTEFAHLKASPQIFDRRQDHLYPISEDDLLFSISEFHYVDVGLNSAGAYLTDRTVIKKVAELLLVHNASVRFVLHGTPRQWFDRHRPWIRKEKDIMLQLLKDEAHRCEGKLQATERFYFANNLPSLQMHFEIIQVMDLS